MIPKFSILIILMLISSKVFSDDSVENIPREKSKVLKNWEVVPGLKSVHEKNFRGNRSEVFKRNKDEILLKRSRKKNQPLLNVENEDEAVVVYNPKRQSQGTVDGTLIVFFTNSADQTEVMKNFPVKIVRQEKKIYLGIYKVKTGNDIEKVVEDLKKDARVKNVEVEVLSNIGKSRPL